MSAIGSLVVMHQLSTEGQNILSNYLTLHPRHASGEIHL